MVKDLKTILYEKYGYLNSELSKILKFRKSPIEFLYYINNSELVAAWQQMHVFRPSIKTPLHG